MIQRKSSPDYILFFVTMALLCLGVVMVFSASMVLSQAYYQDSFYFLKKQATWAGLGVVVLVAFSFFNYRNLRFLAFPGLILSLSLLVLVLIPGVGKIAGGARRWLAFGPVSFQPAEMAKVALVLFLAVSLPQRRRRIRSFSDGLLPYFLLLALIFGLINKQPDLGTALMIGGVFFLIIFVAGARKRHLILISLVSIFLIYSLVKLGPYRYQYQRLMAFKNPTDDIQNTDYQSWQSLLALGSGGLEGVGLGKSKQKFRYLPQPHTDFIFAIIGEELGFLGAIVVITLFLIFAWRGFRIAFLSPNLFSSLLALGITSQIVLQALVNFGVVAGALPVTGIPLPLISFGGSSLVFTLVGIGILLNISQYIRVKPKPQLKIED